MNKREETHDEGMSITGDTRAKPGWVFLAGGFVLGLVIGFIISYSYFSA